MNRVGIILPVFNNIDFTKRTIRNLYDTTYYENYVLIIEDNGSTDGTTEYLKEIRDKDRNKVRLILNEDNVRGNISWNQGIEQNKDCNYFCFTQNDVLHTHGWLTKLVKRMDEEDNLGLISPLPLGLDSCTENNFVDKSNIIMRDKRNKTTFGFNGCCYMVKNKVLNDLKNSDE